jgi:deoxycytidylate deaminase
MNNKDKRYFEKARQAAQLSEFKRARIGCVAVYNNNIISVGINSYKTHPVQKMYDKYRTFHPSPGCKAHMHSLHAEIDCLVSIDDNNIDISKVDIYICRILKNGTTGLAAPCPACKQYLIDRGIKKVHYTTSDSYIEETYKNYH